MYSTCVHVIYDYDSGFQERKIIGEKRVNKNFQYDTPGDLVITYLSEVITMFTMCMGSSGFYCIIHIMRVPSSHLYVQNHVLICNTQLQYRSMVFTLRHLVYCIYMCTCVYTCMTMGSVFLPCLCIAELSIIQSCLLDSYAYTLSGFTCIVSVSIHNFGIQVSIYMQIQRLYIIIIPVHQDDKWIRNLLCSL